MIMDKREKSGMEPGRSCFIKKYGRAEAESAACSAYVRQHWNCELEHRIRIADEVSRNIFLFDLPWDMERTVEPVAFESGIDWMFKPSEDPEFIYQMNRHRYWICLGQAYAVTGDERYAQCFARQLADWIQKNPLTEETKSSTWRTIEAGLRGDSWVKAMGYLAESAAVTDEVFAMFVDAMACHGEYLAACDVAFSVKSNWGVLENSGLYIIGKMLETVGRKKEGAAYAELAKGRLVRQIQVQVMDDGVHWEQSPMYHNEVLKCFLETLRTARNFGEEFPGLAVEKVKKMAYANLFWQKPDGSQPAGGDSDVTGLRDILTTCAAWFGDPVLKSGGYSRLDYESVWDYGMEMAEEYEALPVQIPKETFVWLRDSGNWYLRSSWKEDADYLHFRCGGLGGGHGHFDKLHLDLFVGGEEVLTDPGRYTYVDGVERRRLKSTEAHNSLTVDGSEYSRCLGSWGVEGLFPAVVGNSSQKGPYTLMECGHLAYMDRGIYVERRIVAIGTGIFVIFDTCYGGAGSSSFHTYEQHFHPSPGLKMTCLENGFALEGSTSHTTFLCATEPVEAAVEAFEVSRHYNHLEQGRIVTLRTQRRSPAGMITVAVGQKKEQADLVHVEKVPVSSPVSQRILEDWEAEAVYIRCGSQSYLVVNSHVDTGADCEYIGARGSYGLGRVMVTDENSRNPEPIVLKW